MVPVCCGTLVGALVGLCCSNLHLWVQAKINSNYDVEWVTESSVEQFSVHKSFSGFCLLMQYVFQSTTTAYKYFGFWEWAKVFYIFVTFFVFVSSLEGGTFSLHLCSFLPPCCLWPSFPYGQFFWGCVPLFLGLGTLWCCAEAEPRKSARFTITILKHFVPFSRVSSEAIGNVAQGFKGGMLCLAGRASKTYFYLCQVLHIIYKLVSPPWLETT